MNHFQLIRYFTPDDGPRLGILRDGHIADVTDAIGSLTDWLESSVGQVGTAINDLQKAAENAPVITIMAALTSAPSPNSVHLLAPVEDQDVWASGVTYERSRAARQEEAIDGGDIYARVYGAQRPELFFKARGTRVVPPGAAVGIRHDATWNVPEPELALVMNPAMEVVGYTIGNDMSSRDIEGENPLYLPQAKVYTASCALGPAITLTPLTTWPQTTISITITRDGSEVFAENISTDRIHRTVDDLVTHLGRCQQFPDGAVLLTGTGIVPPSDFTLQAGDSVSITIDGVGTLTNPVMVID